MSQQNFSYSYPPQESPFAQTLREADEKFYATFPDARIAAQQQGRLSCSNPANDFGVSFYLNSQLYPNQPGDQGGQYAVGYANTPHTASPVESNLHYTYLSPAKPSSFQSTSALPQVQSNGNPVQSGSMGAPQYPSAQSTFDDVPPLAWATPMAAGHGGYLPSMAYPPVSAQSASGLEARAQQNGSMYPTTAYRNEMVAAVAPVNTYPETTYQPSPSVLPSPPVPQLPTQHAAAPSPPSIQRHSRDRRSQSHPYPLSVKVEDKANTLASPLTSPIRPAHHPGHSRQPTQVQTSARRSSPSRGSWSPGRSSPSRQTTSNSRSGVPLSPLPSQRQIEKKPPLACLFCRGRKIACGPPVAGSLDRTCNQCQRRCLQCEYPAESRRGMRKKKNTESSTSSAEQSQTSVATPPTFPGEGTLEP